MTKVNLEQTDIFSMFDITDEVAEQKKHEEEERKKKAEKIRMQIAEAQTASTSNPVGKKPEPVTFEVNEETVIRHYGESLEITSYFTTEELAEGLLVNKNDGETVHKPLDGELLRKRMEKDFPEMVKDHTEVVFLKAKNIIVITQKAKKKGSYCSDETVSVDSVSSLSFPFPKIPFQILRDFIAVARLYGEINLEVHADVYYQVENGEFFLDFPIQVVHKYWVEVVEESSDIVARVEDAVKVLEIHSHHQMQPIPSRQDNESERVPGRYYAIVGNTQKMLPDIYTRKFLSEQEGHATVQPEQIFEDPFHAIPAFNMNAIEVDVK